MSNRLNQEREKKLQPIRMTNAFNWLKENNFNPIKLDDTTIQFLFKGSIVNYYPYSGWATGKQIKDGRGWKNLQKQLVDENHD